MKQLFFRCARASQSDIWDVHMNRIELSDVLASFRAPAQFQLELAALIDSYARVGRPKIIEIGCETAVTTLLLDDRNDRTVIDINKRAITLVQDAASHLNMKITALVCDMFEMPLADAEFDIVFNAGVIEHFSKEDRVRAITEYSRIMRNDGLMIIAFPNHYCPPYRFAYWTMRLLGIWRFPSEYKIFDLAEEAKNSGLRVIERRTLSRGTIFNWLNFLPPAKGLFQLLDRFFNYEGYLTVVVLSKTRI